MRKIKQFICGLIGHNFEGMFFDIEQEENVIDIHDHIIVDVCTKCEKIDPKSVFKI